MRDDEMNQNRGGSSEYQPVIDRLREIAMRGMNQESGETDPAKLRRNEFAGSQGSQDGQMMNREMLDTIQKLMSNPEMMKRIMDWINEGGMMDQPYSQTAASVPGMPPPENFADGSTPYTRLQDRINRIGKNNVASRQNGNSAY